MINSLIKVSKKYTDLSSFQQALIHKSISRIKNNERLEFLGDAVLEIVISEYLFNNFSKFFVIFKCVSSKEVGSAFESVVCVNEYILSDI